MKVLQQVFVVVVMTALVLLVASGAGAGSKQGQVAGTLDTLQASSYTSNGASISGWNWLRASGNNARWTFDVSGTQDAKRGTAYLNLNALATKGVSGGSGWGGSLSLRLKGAMTKKATIRLSNPFRPRSSTDSHGVGYQAYGAVAIPYAVYHGATTIKVVAMRSRGSVFSNIRVAVNKNAPVIAYLKTPIIVYAMK